MANINKVRIEETGKQYDICKQVLTLDDINPECFKNNNYPEFAEITLNDKDYNNKHIIIDTTKLNQKLGNSISGIALHLKEENKNCTIQFVINSELSSIDVNGGFSNSVSNSILSNDTNFNFTHMLAGFANYPEDRDAIFTENCNNYISFNIRREDEHYYNIISLIINIDSYGNVDYKPITNFEL